ncbi:hypothetical protein [Glycomyces harbinensis]|nr:hypothetical protein [Glycomyces harbinensis]
MKHKVIEAPLPVGATDTAFAGTNSVRHDPPSVRHMRVDFGQSAVEDADQ